MEIKQLTEFDQLVGKTIKEVVYDGHKFLVFTDNSFCWFWPEEYGLFLYDDEPDFERFPLLSISLGLLTKEEYKQILRIAELYGRSKWDEACHAQKQACHFVTPEDPNFIRLRIDNAPKPEFKP